MKKTLISTFVAFASISAQAAPLCSPQDVREAAINLSGFKDALDLGAIPKTVYLEHERVLFEAQNCGGEISRESYCRSVVKSWREQLSIARDNFDRAARMRTFEKYIAEMSALKPTCSDVVLD